MATSFAVFLVNGSPNVRVCEGVLWLHLVLLPRIRSWDAPRDDLCLRVVVLYIVLIAELFVEDWACHV